MKYVKKNQVQIIFILLLCLLFILFSNCSFFGMQKDDGKPSVAITFPVDGAEVSGTITLQAVAGDDEGIYKVTFKVDGGVLGDSYSAPYEKSWNTANEPQVYTRSPPWHMTILEIRRNPKLSR